MPSPARRIGTSTISSLTSWVSHEARGVSTLTFLRGISLVISKLNSEEKVIGNHKWNIPEKYSVNVISKDTNGILSEWSEISYISIIDKINIFDYYGKFLQTIYDFILEMIQSNS